LLSILVPLTLVTVSYVSYHRLQEEQSGGRRVPAPGR